MVDSIITLFESTETAFATNGLGSLPDAISCLVEEEINGEYELEMEYPVDGRRYSDLVLRRIIFTKIDPTSKGQPFRIYAISKPINGVVTINAQHISYDLSGYPLKPFSATDIQKTFTGLKTNSVENHPFIFSSDKNLTLPFSLKTPVSTRLALGGMEGSVLDVYRGEYEWDKFNVILHTKRGVNRGVTIRYGKNLTDIKQDENCDNVYTGVYPYWYSEDDEGNSVLVELTEKLIQTPGTFNYVKILALDLTEQFQEKPTLSDLKTVAQSYISTHEIGVPTISIDVAFEPLMRSPEYAEFAMLETVKLGDTVTVEFPKMDIQATSKCVKTIFNVITDKYVTITLGSTKSNLASTMAGQARAIAEKPSSYIIDVIKAAVFEKVSIDQLEASNATITNLVVETAQIADARIYNLEVDTAEITDLVAENIVSINLHTQNITAMNADIQDLEVSRATIAELEATNANVTNLQAEVADIDTLVSGNLTSENIQSLNLTSKNTVIEDAMIKDAMIADLGVDKLKAGNISTNKFNLVSDSGNFTIVDNTIQVTDGTKVRVQIGKDASGDYSMYVWDVAGKLMFDAKGITEDAIQSAIIRDDMVSTDANINAAKIDIGSLFKVINEDNTQTLNSSKIMFDAEGQTLNIKLQSLTTSIDTAEQDAKDYADGKLADYATTIVSQIDGLQGQIDGSIMTWFFPVPPTLLNEPASKWKTTDDKNVHLGDLYYDTISGYCYRWQVVNNAYSWQRITDTDVTKALEDASKAQDTADTKRRVFLATPTVPYDKFTSCPLSP